VTKRKLLVLLLGIGCLIVITWVATVVPDQITLKHPSASIQTAQAGPYQVTLQVDPNPPQTTRPATLSLQVVRQDTKQLVNNAHITLASSMETMDMGTDYATAQQQNDGSYQAHVQFSMSGPWQLHVAIAVPGTGVQSVNFEITAQ
jgi:YtkA-like